MDQHVSTSFVTKVSHPVAGLLSTGRAVRCSPTDLDRGVAYNASSVNEPRRRRHDAISKERFSTLHRHVVTQRLTSRDVARRRDVHPSETRQITRVSTNGLRFRPDFLQSKFHQTNRNPPFSPHNHAHPQISFIRISSVNSVHKPRGSRDHAIQQAHSLRLLNIGHQSINFNVTHSLK